MWYHGAAGVPLHVAACRAAERLLVITPGLASHSAASRGSQRAAGPMTATLQPFSAAAKRLLGDYRAGLRVPQTREEALVAAGLVFSCTVDGDGR